jgi:hypothetical protein
MPHLVGALGERDALELPPAGIIENAQLDALRVFGEQREVNAFAVPGSAARVRAPGPYCRNRCHRLVRNAPVIPATDSSSRGQASAGIHV